MLLLAAALVLTQSGAVEKWDGKEVLLEVGTERQFRFPGVQRIAPGCRDSHDVKTIGNGVVVLMAFAECRGVHLIWLTDGRRITLPFRSVGSIPKPDLKVPVKKRENARGTEVEIPEALHDLREERAPDGGMRIVGYNAANQRVTIDIIEVQAPDAGK